jgi:hypothetical protein
VGIQYRLLTTALPFVAGLGLGSVCAQETGGVALTFGLSQRLETTENLSLSSRSAGRTTQAITELSFNLLTETRVQRLSFDAEATLRAVTGGGRDGADIEFGDPRASLDYQRTSANARFNLSGYTDVADIAFLRTLEDFRGTDGEIDLPDDLSDLSGTGTRRSYGAETSLDWGDAGPVGFGLFARFARIDYVDATDPDLIDNQRVTLGATLRLSLNAATDLTFGLDRQTYEDAAPNTRRRTTTGFDVGIARELTNGSLTADLSIDRTAGGTRTALNFGRSLELPNGALTAGVGIGRSAAGRTNLTGNLTLQQALADGQLTATLQRGFTTGTNDSEELTTSLSLDYTKQITSRGTLGLGLTYVDNQDTATDLATKTASLSASYTYALTPDWGLTAGYTQRLRQEEPNARANSGTAFVVLSRDFVFKY